MKRVIVIGAFGLNLLLSACENDPASETPAFAGKIARMKRVIVDFLDKSTIGDPPADPPPWITNLAIVDLDQDGLLDVVLCDATRNQVSWIRQAPLGTFTESALSVLVIAPQSRTNLRSRSGPRLVGAYSEADAARSGMAMAHR